MIKTSKDTVEGQRRKHGATVRAKALCVAALVAVILCCGGCTTDSISDALGVGFGGKSNNPGGGGGGGYVGKGNNIANYRTVTIGGQRWMAENLDYNTTNSWCYGNNSSNCAKYGRLYTWEAAKSACASMGGGWHLPTRAEWDVLVEYVGSSTAGTKLKSASGWNSNGNGTDTYGFSALPGGYRYYDDGGFDNVGYRGGWWSATENGSNYAYYRLMYYNYGYVVVDNYYRSYGFSARCVAQD